MIKLKGVYKSYGTKNVLVNCSFEVKQGEIYALLGENGAGKSTIFKLITGLAYLDMGEIELLGNTDQGKNYLQLKEIGFFINKPVFYEHLSAEKNLSLHLEYMGVKKTNLSEVLSRVGLPTNSDLPVKNYSLGMKQRLGIARALIHDPQILILDEPINGLDPAGIQEMRNLFIDLAKQEGKTLLISSHILKEVELIADRVGVLVNGQIVLDEPIETLQEKGAALEDYLIEKMGGLTK